MTDVREGDRFGSLEVLLDDCRTYSWKKSRERAVAERSVLVQCDCGLRYVVLVKNLISARSIGSCRSCRRAVTDTRKALAGARANIIQRCENPSNPEYRRYGARGISLWKPWRDSQEKFVDDLMAELGERPQGHSLDRIDNDGNYEPGNLRWADARTQQLNREPFFIEGNRTNHPRGPRQFRR